MITKQVVRDILSNHDGIMSYAELVSCLKVRAGLQESLVKQEIANLEKLEIIKIFEEVGTWVKTVRLLWH